MQRQEGGLWGRGQPPKQVGGCWGYEERPEPSRETFISQDHVFKSRRLLHHARNKMRPPYLSTRYSLHGLSSITGQSLVCIVGSVNYTSLEPGLFYSGLSWASLTCQMVKYVIWAQGKFSVLICRSLHKRASFRTAPRGTVSGPNIECFYHLALSFYSKLRQI